MDDPAIPEGIGLARALVGVIDDMGSVGARPLVLLTARPARLAETTMAWMARHGVAWALLVMRVDSDHRTSPDMKREALADLRATGHEPAVAVDDDPRNAEMYWGEGVPVVYVHSGYYD